MPTRSTAANPTHTEFLLPDAAPLPHAGELLWEEFLKPAGISQRVAAERMGMTRNRLNEVIRGKRGVSADTALRLAALLDMSPEFWMRAQMAWDLWHARQTIAGDLVEIPKRRTTVKRRGRPRKTSAA